MEKVKDDDLSVYSVWVPILVSDAERAVPNALTRLPDKRVTHFWDGNTELVEAYKTILPTKSVETGEFLRAWDVYLLFDKNSQWKDRPPTPTFWMHQLYSADPNKTFSGEALAAEVEKQLK